jgi:hypothetical protein
MSNDKKTIFVNHHKFGSPRYIKQLFQDTHLNPFSFVRVTIVETIKSDVVMFSLKFAVFMIVLFSVIHSVQFLLRVAS